MIVRATPRITGPLVVFAAAKIATGRLSTTARTVATTTIASVCPVITSSSPSGGKSSGNIREKKFAALSRLRTIDATLISRAATDQIAAPSTTTSAVQAATRFTLGRGCGGNGISVFVERGASMRTAI